MEEEIIILFSTLLSQFNQLKLSNLILIEMMRLQLRTERFQFSLKMLLDPIQALTAELRFIFLARESSRAHKILMNE